MTIHAAQALADDCLRLTRHQPHQALEWLVDDVLADFGVKPTEPPPEDMHDWLFEHSGQYARAVAAHPFQDMLGQTYEAIASRGRRAGLGQFFTPDHVAQLMGAVLTGNDPRHAQAREDGRLWTMCEPTCGSGALLLGFLDNLITAHGPAALRHWSVTGIDLDRLCARMCAAQVLSNVFLHVSNRIAGAPDVRPSTPIPETDSDTSDRPGLGELVIYCGNSLGPLEHLRVVIHATRRDLGADLVLPALHPARVAMLRQAQRHTPCEATDAFAAGDASHRPARSEAASTPKAGKPRKAPRHAPADTAEHALEHASAQVAQVAGYPPPSTAHAPTRAIPAAAQQVDLFAD